MLLLLPFSGGSPREKGQEQAPSKIFEEIKKIETTLKGDLNPLLNINPIVLPLDNSNIEISQNLIQLKVSELLTKKEKFCAIGGDHSVSYPIFKSLLSLHPDAGLIVLDAHPDVEPSTGIASHDTWIRDLINAGLDTSRVFILGLRNIGREEVDFLNSHKIRHYSSIQLKENLDNICDVVMQEARNWQSVWISFDIDVLDPSIAPGTFYLEPFGLTSYEVLHIIRRFLHLKNIAGIDLVEVNPKFDVRNITIKTAARFVVDIYGHLFKDNEKYEM